MNPISRSDAGRGTGRALWASTALETKGGVASYVRTLAGTPLYGEWSVRHIVTHRDGSVVDKVVTFVVALLRYEVALLFHRPDLVHLHMASNGSFLRKATMAGLARASRVPVVIHLHGGGFEQFHDGSPRPLRAVIRSTLAHAAVVVALGEQWARRIERIAPTARIAVVPNAIAPVAAAVQPAPGEPVRVVCLGKLHADKGTFVLLDAWAKVVGVAEHPVRLLIAGNGELEQARARVEELGLGNTVTVSSWLSGPEVTSLLRSAHVLTLPSLAEGQPMAVLEAMAHGLCVVASDVGGIPDLLGDDAGLLVPPGDVHALAAALLRAVDDGDERTRLGERGLARVRSTFDTAVVWRRIDGLYREVVQRVSTPR